MLMSIKIGDIEINIMSIVRIQRNHIMPNRDNPNEAGEKGSLIFQQGAPPIFIPAPHDKEFDKALDMMRAKTTSPGLQVIH